MATRNGGSGRRQPSETDPKFENLLSFLKENRGFDFTGYKRASLMRRVDRQMQIAGIASYDEYQDYLELHPEEFTALFNTILINVTSFFRDSDAWAYLSHELLPKLVQDPPTDVLRMWSAACASGEEAFSLAICLAELLGPDEFRARVKIYATDVDEEALAFARQATYSDRQLSGLTSEQIEKYFEPSNGKFAFRKDLRRSVIFGRNDLVRDAPIARTDLLVCRNTLMYFNAEQQARILQRLHFALNPNGILFLGKAEMLLSHGALFEPIDVKRRFFRRAVVDAPPERGVFGITGRNTGIGADGRDLALLSGETLLTSPVAQVVIDPEGQLALVNQRAEGLFNMSQRDLGRPFQDLEVSYRPIELRSYIDQVAAERRPMWVRGIEWPRHPGETMYLDVQLVPLQPQGLAGVGISITFTDVTRYRQLQNELEYANRQLETAYEELQSTVEELETTNEELQSTVEELETTNEELQSTNEELETMNDELQSMNDELQSSNDELRVRTTEIDELNRFMESFLSSLRAAVAVTDRDLKLLVWNHRAEDLWGVRRDEAVGQHLLNLDIGLPLEKLRPLLRRTLAATDGAAAAEELSLEAINRRGKPLRVRATATQLRGSNGDAVGVILVLDPEEVVTPTN